MRLKILKPCLLVFTLLLSQAGSAVTVDDVHTFTLKNDMKFLVMEDDSIPNATLYIFWKVGSRNEAPGTTGIAHFFEHMMFNGAKKYGPKMFDKVMEAHGGSNNAYTSENVTAYMEWFPADGLDKMFELEADRIASLSLDPNIVESERGVVTSERLTGLENSNYRTIWEEVKSAAFRAHPYSWPIIGHASDIENWTMQDLKEFHRIYYAPNNAVAIVVGNVKADNVKQLAKKHFESIPKQEEPKSVHTVEPEQKGERRVYVHKPSVTSPNIMMGYHIPANQHKDFYPLVLLSDILTEGNSSRLVSKLVHENELAMDVGTDVPDSIDPNLFYLYAIASQGVSAAELETAVLKEIARVAKHGVTEEELQRAKNQREVAFYRDIATISDRANLLGNYEIYHGSYRKMFSAPNDFAKVTAADIQRVAATYLTKKNRTVGVLDSREDSDEFDL
ncbi:insulinase family protein [Paraneptunicella aestuarii]|uniref:M16 family metallopeptidase n=1 Tax=Paraneptunicella aestuarii TaxID=2831148 RepID=UPI001E42042B|nr:pitrilysin family protein [Paraneptunicella aestuarii]UAA38457.1 insulinase family protein [Paraneptunicella aestuarii]